MKTGIFIIFTAFTLISCDLYYELKHSFIHPDIKPYVESFKHEAEIRGVPVDMEGLVVDFGDLDGEAGTSYLGRRKVIIDKDKFESYNAEELVFHELAHVLLGKEHDNRRMGKNSMHVRSLMHKSESAAFAWDGLSYRREYYINQLFNPNTPEPEWAFK